MCSESIIFTELVGALPYESMWIAFSLPQSHSKQLVWQGHVHFKLGGRQDNLFPELNSYILLHMPPCTLQIASNWVPENIITFHSLQMLIRTNNVEGIIGLRQKLDSLLREMFGCCCCCLGSEGWNCKDQERTCARR